MHTHTHIADFQQLVAAAAAQPQPQQLLFVFTAAELPSDATEAERRRFEAGQGGALAPVICVDKAPADLSDFAALLAESQRAGPPWQVMFAASLSGRDAHPPTAAEIETALNTMVEAVRTGRIGGFAAFGPDGETLNLR